MYIKLQFLLYDIVRIQTFISWHKADMLPFGNKTQLNATVTNLNHYTTIECDLAPTTTPSQTTAAVQNHSPVATTSNNAQPAYKTVTND